MPSVAVSSNRKPAKAPSASGRHRPGRPVVKHPAHTTCGGNGAAIREAPRRAHPAVGHARGLSVGGLTPLTTIDYPGELAVVVFCRGCPWRCRYCHNGHLLSTDGAGALAWPDVMAFLRRRRGLLDALVFSGGEPTAQRSLGDAIGEARRLGFKIGLHTAGCYPQRLAALLPQIDWVGLDIKALPGDYPALTGVAHSGEPAWRSLRLLTGAGIPYEVRVTVHDSLLPPPQLHELLDRLRSAGARDVMLQNCHTQQILDPSLGRNGLDWPEERRRALS